MRGLHMVKSRNWKQQCYHTMQTMHYNVRLFALDKNAKQLSIYIYVFDTRSDCRQWS